MKMDYNTQTVSPCPTCLSLGRAMLPLRDVAATYTMLLAGAQTEVDLGIFAAPRVCWECHGTLNRIVKFQAQVLEANSLLRRASHLIDDQMNTLSRLSNATKRGYDYEFEHETFEDDFFGAEWELPVADLRLKSEDIEQEMKTEHDVKEESKTSMKEKKKVAKRTVKKKSRAIKNGKRDVVTWPGRKVLLKGGNRNVKIVSIEMSEEEMLKYREEDRNSKQFVDAPYKCTDCVKGFSHENVYERHNNTHHRESIGPHSCPICGTRYASSKHMKRHVRAHYSVYVCSECGFTHRGLPNVVRHYNAAHDPGKTYPCDHCQQVFPTGRKMRYHRDAVHKDVHQCEHCDKILSNSASLKCHLLIHTGMATFECSVCRKPCRGESGLYSHMRTVHKQETGEDTYCADCNVQFKTRYNYRTHIRTSVKHASPAQLKFPCTKCKKKCISETALRQHDRYYHQEYVCHICSKRHNNWYSLDKHVKFKHEGRERPRRHVCETCGKAFTTRGALLRHQLTHTGERPHACDICGTKFAQKSTLTTHQKLVHFKNSS